MVQNPNSEKKHFLTFPVQHVKKAETEALIFWEAGKKRLLFSGVLPGFQQKTSDHPISLYALIRHIGLEGWYAVKHTLGQAADGQLLRLGLNTSTAKENRLHLYLVKYQSSSCFRVTCFVKAGKAPSQPVIDQALPLLLEKLPMVLNLMDESGRVMHLKGGGLHHLNIQEDETVGQSIFEQYPPISPYVQRAMQGEQVRFKEEIRQNGNTHYFLSYFLPLSELNLIAGLSIELISQEKEAEETAFHRIQNVNKELKERNQLLDTVVYATAHDLKTPIANLEVLMNLYESATTEEERNNFWRALRQSALRLKSTSQGLMEVITFDNTESSAQTLDFPELSRSLLEEYRSQLEKLNASVSLSFKVKHIKYNKAYLESILRNLISNSIKYHKEERSLEIRIKTEATDTGILLEVSDNGIGIDMKAHKSRIFKPFKRFSEQAEGSGVGLYLLKRIIERNGGTIQIASAPDKGCSVHCLLIPYP